jgi:hypothetical protein
VGISPEYLKNQNLIVEVLQILIHEATHIQQSKENKLKYKEYKRYKNYVLQDVEVEAIGAALAAKMALTNKSNIREEINNDYRKRALLIIWENKREKLIEAVENRLNLWKGEIRKGILRGISKKEKLEINIF